MLENAYRLVSRIDLMETLCEAPVGDPDAREAIQEAASDIECSEPGDLVAAYAREIRQTIAEMDAGNSPQGIIRNCKLGEQISRLGQWVESLANGFSATDATGKPAGAVEEAAFSH